ncbi:hypothetical protein [Corynebacterium sp. ES2775-CONJ]|uniref:hypothetical protein n=1 Tax=Corynebacterium sp. ES2775-CONJ TaxID=2974029 RepID=UPI00216A9A4A|nr:hypothetical protein [Corynebacterium sp. ES2775-CONJ]MCS4489629.1 hypothetical protein [Corynebacterium sp. ES2775-CONJ]
MNSIFPVVPHCVTSSRIRLVRWGVSVLAVTGGIVSVALPTALAIPPGGAGPDTPGTSSSVSPSVVEQCGTLSYQVNGYPAGEVVNIKIDDGRGFGGDASVQGQGVIARQKIDSSGTASGSISVPCDLPPGEHYLRYLATEGTKNLGYTSVGNSYFTVTATVETPATNQNTQSTPTQSARGRVGQSRNSDRASAQPGGRNRQAAQPREEVVYVDEYVDAPAQAASPNQAAQAPQNLDNSAARPEFSGDTHAAGSAASAPANTGIFDKKKQQQQNVAQAAANGSSPSAPYVGFFVGLAILLVGMTAINAWLVVQRRQ